MKNIYEYIVIEATSVVILMHEVNKHIGLGYQPLGGVSSSIDPSLCDEPDFCEYFVQAMGKLGEF